MPVKAKLDSIPVKLPTSPPQDVFVNFRVVVSSNVARIGWDKNRNMYVEFISGLRYMYSDVSRQRAVAAAYHPSCGAYINRRIKGHFATTKLS